MFDINTLREEYKTLHTSAETLIAKAAEEKRDLTADEITENDKQFARMTTIRATLDRQSKLAEHAFAEKKETVTLSSEPEGKADLKVTDRFNWNDIECRKEFFANTRNKQAYLKAVSEWGRTGRFDNRFATITGSTDSGILMPVEVVQPIAPSAMNTFREALSVYGMDSWKTPTTATINLPIFTAAAGSTVAGTATTETEQEPAVTESVSSVTTTYHSGNIWFENRELAAVDFDLLAATVPAAKYSKELAFESAVATAISGDATATIVNTSTPTAFTYANLVSLNRQLPKRYNTLKVIILSKAAYTAAENLVTTTGFPILNQDAQNQGVKRFNGTPVLYSEYFAAFAANNVIGCVFSWVGSRLRDAGDGDILQRYTQAYTRQGQTGFDLYGYHSFNYSSSAMAKFVCAPS